jgi:hypothetical protein
MDIKKIIDVVSRSYDAHDGLHDGIVECYYEEPEVNHGDGLAKFIALEIKECCASGEDGHLQGMAKDVAQVDEAIRVMKRAAEQLYQVVSGLENFRARIVLQGRKREDLREFESSSGQWRLEWVDLGEGLQGDYDPDDPEDVALLRADLYERIDGIWTEVPDGSYCTVTPVGTDADVLRKISDDLFLSLGSKPSSCGHAKKLMQAWTWRTDPAKLPK